MPYPLILYTISSSRTPLMTDLAKKKPSRAESLYRSVKDMAILFEFKPGERINEVGLAQRLGASRTPLREALNRLVAEGFLVLKQDRGFFCRELKPREMFELYQFRAVLEVAAIRLACEQATEQEVADLAQFLDETGPQEGGRNSQELVALDEFFHEKIMALSRNMEMSRTLENINARIKYFRWVDMDSKREGTQQEHRAIVQALMARDADLAARRMETHITRRLEQITAAIKESYSRIYLVS
jgi:DNA-binding GntR family transcriptional regulator